MHMRRVFTIVGAAALLVTSGCSKDDSGAKSSTTEKADKTTTTEDEKSNTTKAGSGDNADLAAALASGDLPLSEEESQCLADALVGEYGEETALELADTSSPPPDDKLDAISTMFADCVSAESYSKSILDTAFAGQTVDEATYACVADAMEGKVNELVIEGYSDGERTTLTAILDECISPELYAGFLIPVVDAMGVQSETECVAEKVAAAIPLSQLMAGFDGDEPSQEVMDALNEAAAACGAEI